MSNCGGGAQSVSVCQVRESPTSRWVNRVREDGESCSSSSDGQEGCHRNHRLPRVRCVRTTTITSTRRIVMQNRRDAFAWSTDRGRESRVSTRSTGDVFKNGAAILFVAREARVQRSVRFVVRRVE